MATQEELDNISKVLTKARIATLTTVASDGALHSRPLALQEREFDGDLWFFTPKPTEKTDEIAQNPNVNVAVHGGDGYLSIAGTASIVTDEAKIDELWGPSAEAWFEKGREDPRIALVKVSADSAEYWVNNDPKIVTLFKVAKATTQKKSPDVGENEAVEL
ncbi:general stress protein [Leifsonia sp. ALI-44-B]|jgi:general stress protein 26|uniref:pyridoxamine 5'-phosphate oxidase family protein n=1 Tax=Leifsonia sp. ALI-44-B TaxID=1933776 RepID=UPI00097C6ED3|nr:pyridoxamine 5'-phosphate oxidase family protein [Leifsonia sp. ALI-44-B]ONI61536.1 general stress protein [Leifsonia sp. ALI-44-B]